MYTLLKKILQFFLPQSILKPYQGLIRKGVYFFFRGKDFHCPICQAELRRFIRLPNGEMICPLCGSLPRTRRLFDLLQKENLSGKIVHFSPPRCLYEWFNKNEAVQYISSDLESEFLADYNFDITNIELPDNSIDLFIAFHILEHIVADRKAMKELFRILKPAGKGFIQTPFKSGQIYENPAIQHPEDRQLHFGQKDHVRIYSVSGLKERLISAGFKVKTLSFNEKTNNRSGFKEKEVVFLVEKK